jgi:allantoinase
VALADSEFFTVTAASIKHRHPVTPYLDQQLRGVVRTRWLRGTELEDDMVAGQLLSK